MAIFKAMTNDLSRSNFSLEYLYKSKPPQLRVIWELFVTGLDSPQL
jgi:hypothetical protein